ncbi:hypothetical protein X975_13947, partial [Stegodyphus mimosarum]
MSNKRANMGNSVYPPTWLTACTLPTFYNSLKFFLSLKERCVHGIVCNFNALFKKIPSFFDAILVTFSRSVSGRLCNGIKCVSITTKNVNN